LEEAGGAKNRTNQLGTVLFLSQVRNVERQNAEIQILFRNQNVNINPKLT
jgi:hypothetical protein